MVNYKNSKIYKLVSNKNKNQIYVGTTTQKLTGRISWHRRKHQINDDTKIILIKNFPCETKEQLNAELYKQMNFKKIAL
jgi:esterase/lipase superfamily enzyme